MKKKAILAVLMLSAALTTTACGEPKESAKADSAASQQTDKNDEGTDKETDEDKDTQKDGQEEDQKKDQDSKEETGEDQSENKEYRLVSVDDVGKYISLGEYKGLSLDNTVAPVSDDQIESRIESELTQHATLITDADTTVEEGDIANVSYVGTKDGVAFEGGTGDNYDLTIGSGQFIEGFEEGIVGMKKGETKDVKLTFPEAYPAQDLAGQDVVFQITLNSIKRASELNDEWVEKNTDYATVDEYRAGLAVEMAEEAKATMEQSLIRTAFSSVLEGSEVKEYPQEDLDRAAGEYRSQIEYYAQQAGMELEDLLKAQNMSEEDFQEQCDQYAQFRVKQALVVQGIMDAEGLTFTDEKCVEQGEKLAKQYGEENFQGLVSLYGEQASYESLGLDYVSQFLVDNAKLKVDNSQEEAEASKDETFKEGSGDTKADTQKDTEEDSTEDSKEDTKEDTKDKEDTKSEEK